MQKDPLQEHAYYTRDRPRPPVLVIAFDVRRLHVLPAIRRVKCLWLLLEHQSLTHINHDNVYPKISHSVQ